VVGVLRHPTMFEMERTVPQDSLFHDDIFDKTCEKMKGRNKARVVQDIARLIVPSAETLATFGAKQNHSYFLFNRCDHRGCSSRRNRSSRRSSFGTCSRKV